MYICTNCAGRLKYDIATKSLLCESCASSFPIGAVKESKVFKKNSVSEDKYEEIATEDVFVIDDKESAEDYYTSYIFTCPQCGGEIRCDVNEAAAFCPYCGASNVLEGRLSNEKKPEYILPFSVDKDKCKEIYSKYLKSKLFAPSDILKEGAVDGFRGIYMPYWVYNIYRKGPIVLKGEKTRHSVNYTYYDEYDLTGKLDVSIEGFMYDASSSFYDDYSQCISPYDMKDSVPFDTSYMAGFYADTADVAHNLYVSKAEEMAGNIVYYEYVEKEFKKIHPKTPSDIPTELNLDSSDRKSALLPVWFMSYKYKGRMLYSAINGQTGEIAADIPISVTKYVIGSLFLFVPIFIILNMILSLNGPKIAFAAALISVIVSIVYAVMSSKLRKIETKELDKGYVFAHSEDFDVADLNQTEKSKNDLKKETKGFKNKIALIIGGGYLLIQFVCPLVFALFAIGASLSSIFWGLILQILCIVILIVNLRKKNKSVISHRLGFIMPFISGMLSAMMLILLPTRDIFYYLVSIVALIGIIIAVISLVSRYNEMISRPMPQFKREGGDDNA